MQFKFQLAIKNLKINKNCIYFFSILDINFIFDNKVAKIKRSNINIELHWFLRSFIYAAIFTIRPSGKSIAERIVLYDSKLVVSFCLATIYKLRACTDVYHSKLNFEIWTRSHVQFSTHAHTDMHVYVHMYIRMCAYVHIHA